MNENHEWNQWLSMKRCLILCFVSFCFCFALENVVIGTPLTRDASFERWWDSSFKIHRPSFSLFPPAMLNQRSYSWFHEPSTQETAAGKKVLAYYEHYLNITPKGFHSAQSISVWQEQFTHNCCTYRLHSFGKSRVWGYCQRTWCIHDQIFQTRLHHQSSRWASNFKALIVIYFVWALVCFMNVGLILFLMSINIRIKRDG